MTLGDIVGNLHHLEYFHHKNMTVVRVRDNIFIDKIEAHTQVLTKLFTNKNGNSVAFGEKCQNGTEPQCAQAWQGGENKSEWHLPILLDQISAYNRIYKIEDNVALQVITTLFTLDHAAQWHVVRAQKKIIYGDSLHSMRGLLFRTTKRSRINFSLQKQIDDYNGRSAILNQCVKQYKEHISKQPNSKKLKVNATVLTLLKQRLVDPLYLNAPTKMPIYGFIKNVDWSQRFWALCIMHNGQYMIFYLVKEIFSLKLKNDHTTAWLLKRMKGICQEDKITFTFDQLRHICTDVCFEKEQFNITNPQLKLLLDCLEHAHYVVNVIIYGNKVPTTATVALCIQHLLSYFLKLGDYCLQKYGFDVKFRYNDKGEVISKYKNPKRKNNPMLKIYINEMCEFFADWLMQVCMELDISPLVAIEERFEFKLQSLNNALLSIKMPRNLGLAQEKRVLLDFYNQNNYRTSSAAMFNPVPRIWERVFFYWCPCSLERERLAEEFKMFDLNGESEVDGHYRSLFESTNIRLTMYEDSKTSKLTQHFYLTPNGGFLCSPQILYIVPSKNAPNRELPQHNHAKYQFDDRNTTFYCNCGSRSVRKRLFVRNNFAMNYRTAKKSIANVEVSHRFTNSRGVDLGHSGMLPLTNNQQTESMKRIDYMVPLLYYTMAKRRLYYKRMYKHGKLQPNKAILQLDDRIVKLSSCETLKTKKYE